jgi:signal transduction histidine kinase
MLSLPENLRRKLLKWRWGITTALSLILVAVGIIENRLTWQGRFDFELPLLLGLVISLLIGAVLSQENARLKLVHTADYIHLQQALRQQLSDAQDWEEVTTILLQFPRTIVPVRDVSLMILNQTTERYEKSAEWSRDGREIPFLETSPISGVCYTDLEAEPRLVSCRCLGIQAETKGLNCFCLPLSYRNYQIGILNLYFSSDIVLTSDQVTLLNEVAPDMAIGVEHALLQRSIVLHQREGEAMQERFARYLHDSLGHNIAYLRLKLEQLIGEEDLQASPVLRLDMSRMLEVAQESYDQVRNLLSDIRSKELPELSSAILQYATLIARRANFMVKFIDLGDPLPLTPYVHRQILYIAREAIRNIEKHAQAQQVTITISWTAERFTLEISDDGIGFERERLDNQNGHYGLKIMQECTEEIEGSLTLASTPYVGTRVTFWMPIVEKQLAEPFMA